MKSRSASRTPSVIGLAVAMILLTASLSAAHGGDTTLIHACSDRSNGRLRMIKPDESCRRGEIAVDWAIAADGNLAPGSVTGQGDNLAGPVTGEIALGTVGRGNLVNGAIDSSKVDSAFHGSLLTEDEFASFKDQLNGTDADQSPNQPDDLVSFNQVKDLTTPGGNGRISGFLIENESLFSADLGPGAVTNSDLASGAVTSDRQTANYVTSSGDATGPLSSGTETPLLEFPGQLTIPAGGNHVVQLSGQAQVTCECSDGSATISYYLTEDGIRITPILSETISVSNGSAVLHFSDVHRSAEGTHTYNAVVTAQFAVTDSVALTSAEIAAIDLGKAAG